jgi:K+-transporting ATPase KdpF subunit
VRRLGFFAPSLRRAQDHLRRFDLGRRIVSAPFSGSASYGRRVDGGTDRRFVPGRLGPGQVLRAPVEPREGVMLWVGMIVSIGLLVYLCVAMFDAENF